MNIKKISTSPRLAQAAAEWFAQKWDIPANAYYESMCKCTGQQRSIPQWYIALDDHVTIIAGAGVVDNDFHNRKDLSPNLCALYVEEEYRTQGIAKRILEFVRKDMGNMGYQMLYLVTDHQSFYEKCGWHYLTTVTDDEGAPMRLYSAKTL